MSSPEQQQQQQQQQQGQPTSMASPHETTPLFLRAENHVTRLALVDQHGSLSYGDLLSLSHRLCEKIDDVLEVKTNEEGQEARIAFLCPNDSSYVVTQWAVWMSGSICVPLGRNHPVAEIQYFVQDSGAQLLIAGEEFADQVSPVIEKLGVRSIVLRREDYSRGETGVEAGSSPSRRRLRIRNRHQLLLRQDGFREKAALMMYTSGTTGRPKGVVHSYGSLQSQMDDMTETWGWTSSDVILHVLPLHHIHGIVNILMTSLSCGATCVMMTKFDPAQVWSMLLGSNNVPSLPKPINLFMAVPTIYAKLIKHYDNHLNSGIFNDAHTVKTICETKIRLMISGSAALPQPIMDRWREISGHTLLERCGMTETGMLMTNPLHGQRLPGTVGLPFPRVEVCIARENAEADDGYDVLAQGTHRKTSVSPGCESKEGQLLVRGPNVFKGYWNRPEATQEAFTKDGWFKTGDTACYDHENGVYKILGRTSVDIIKCGGYKISALDIERHLLAHPDITDVAVVGLPDLTWGEKIAAVLALQSGKVMKLDDLREWAKDLLATYQLPTVLKILDVLPRNAMGKVNKKDLLRAVFDV